MTFKQIQDLIKLVNKSGLTEFKMKDGEFSIAIRTQNFAEGSTQIVHSSPAVMSMPAPVAAPVTAAAPAAAAPVAETKTEDAGDAGLLEIKSPIVGTFYRSPSPDKDVYVKVGDSVNTGDTVCIVEAMKLFNEIESEVSGKIVKVMVEDASPVEYDQVLYLVDPKG